ncbi:MerR family transcriptional regulator [Xylocopilactobacillus apicola]|uniref:MerR family transcriptional regulator n=1 Tax=Xylocopilactobacillus apicola TaxID=2932184 RepID=A0AAU9DCR5_9LACO|nr:MerR family transcriptional regulator [Xylocopilactobacillus apicola]BDR59350.1 MerR family transcriptional regulator [Xylocopilactobacillus apicola]
MEEVTQKYSIGEFAQQVGLSPYTLRYYENEGLVKPKRDEADRRYYDETDRRWVAFLLHLKGTGMSITQLKTYVKLRAQGDATIPARLQLLGEVKQKCLDEIAQVEENLTVLNRKMDWYAEKMAGSIPDDEDFERYLARFR